MLSTLQERWPDRIAGHALAMSEEALFCLDFLFTFLSMKKV